MGQGNKLKRGKRTEEERKKTGGEKCSKYQRGHFEENHKTQSGKHHNGVMHPPQSAPLSQIQKPCYSLTMVQHSLLLYCFTNLDRLDKYIDFFSQSKNKDKLPINGADV